MRRPKDSNAFTLLELLIVISVVAILAAMLLPSLAIAKRRAADISCVNNLHQISLAFEMYLSDNNDVFPAVDPIMMPEDWIKFYEPLVGYTGAAPLDNGSIMANLGSRSRDTNLFRCPLDHVMRDFDRRSSRIKYFTKRYPFSYTLNCSIASDGRKTEVQAGMASFWGTTADGAMLFRPFKASSIVRPGDKFMLVDELMTYELTNPSRIELYQNGHTSGWEWPRDQVASRHHGKGTVAFSDGHVMLVAPSLGKMEEHYSAVKQ